MSRRAFRVCDWGKIATFNVSHNQEIIDVLNDMGCVYTNGFEVGYINIGKEQFEHLKWKLKDNGEYEEVKETMKEIKKDIETYEGVSYICY